QPQLERGMFLKRIGEILLALAVALALWFAVAEMTSAAGLTGSQVVTVERSDDGELYAALSIVFEAAITDRWALIAVHDQAATWPGRFADAPDRRAEWDVGLAWRP